MLNNKIGFKPNINIDKLVKEFGYIYSKKYSKNRFYS